LKIKDLNIQDWKNSAGRKRSKGRKTSETIWSGAALITSFGVLGLVGWYVLAGGEDGKGGTEKGCEDKVFAFVYSKKVIKPELKYLSSPNFPQAPSTQARSSRDVSVANLGGCTHQVVAWVDANNLLGARVRTYYTVIMQYRDATKDWYHLAQYMALDQSSEALRNKANKLRKSYKSGMPPARPKTVLTARPNTIPITIPIKPPRTVPITRPKTVPAARPKTVPAAPPKTVLAARPKTVPAANDSPARSVSDAPQLKPKDSLKEIERLPAVRGVDVGPPDGVNAPKARKPKSDYQSTEGLRVNGQNSKERLEKMKSAANKDGQTSEERLKKMKAAADKDGQTSEERLKKMKAAANDDYLKFAAKSNEGPTSDPTCRSHGGQPVVGEQYDVVMGSGRIADTPYNVIYYGGNRYVTYKIYESDPTRRQLGTEIGLCRF
jgi:hypothetical protein